MEAERAWAADREWRLRAMTREGTRAGGFGEGDGNERDLGRRLIR
jgi:hypothetical protein